MINGPISLTERGDDGDGHRRDEESLRADAAKNRRLLLDTALHLFEAHGVEAVTMSQVAESAGVGKGTLYRHFPNKTELCEALIDADQRALQERTFARLRENDDPRARLEWFALEALDFVHRNLPMLSGSDDGLLLTHRAHLWWRQTVRGLLLQVRPPVALDLEYATDVVYGMLDPRMLSFQLRRGTPYATLRASLVALIRTLAP